MENHVVELVQPRHTLIGENSILEIPQFLHRLEGTVTALVVTDQGLVKIGTVKKVTDVLDRAGIRYWTYDGVQPNPSVGVVSEAMEQYTRQGCNCIIAIGGGSPIDVAKAVSILAANGGRIEDYCGVRKSARPGVPIVAVNTTAGTGSEVTCAYVITDEVKNVKMVMMDPNCLAYLAINDPTLMVGMPPSLTAATGMDALTHAVEAYICRGATPYTDALAIEAIRLVGRSLRRAVADGCDMQARTDMCWAEYMAGLAFSNAGLGLGHSIAHQLGAQYHIPHGIACAQILPRVMEYNIPACLERMGDIASALGADIRGLSAQEAAQAAADCVRDLSEDIGIRPLHSYGFSMDDIPLLARHAMEDTCTPSNPVDAVEGEVARIIAKTYCEGLVVEAVRQQGF
ncbi:iron-containing alcohol dehydrogenase [Anaerotruncus colihominis]|uniref:iron-containing alcohol dehydrogenase n=1 Tax=Anaerotruncus colihominis TaxID=169435 RepID=UPI0018995707|nr:iron-containing alcohol dehydrogenase [Anaerotruncus colihominis]